MTRFNGKNLRVLAALGLLCLVDTGCGDKEGGNSSLPDSQGASENIDTSGMFDSGAISLVGKQAPDMSATRKDGTILKLSEFSGKKVVVLNFWATWCPPCIEELPSLERLRLQLQDVPVEIIGISVDETWEPVDKLIEKTHVKFQQALDPTASQATKYGTTKFPETFIVDKTGKIRKKLIGAQIWDRGDTVTYLRNLAQE